MYGWYWYTKYILTSSGIFINRDVLIIFKQASSNWIAAVRV